MKARSPFLRDFLRGFLLTCCLFAAVVGAAGTEEYRAHPAYGLLERLLEPPGQVLVQQFSSHNKEGLNGDENWPLYQDEHGDDVIFDASGPGCVRSIWGTNYDAESVIKLYFDGEMEPSITANYIDFFKGQHPLFPPPLVSFERRGHWGPKPYAGNSFVPIPFERSLRVSVSGNSRFFHVIWERYPGGTELQSFTGNEDRSMLLDSFDRLGEDLFIEDDFDVVRLETEIVEPGQEVTLFEIEDTAGIIREIVLEGDGSREFFQESWIRMRWDGHERWDVYAPVGIFFGSAVEAEEVRSLPFRVEVLEGGRARLTAYFPMPFWKQAQIQWINASEHRMAPLRSEIHVGGNELEPTGLYFTTTYRAGETTYGRDWLFFESPGSGWFVGAVQSMQGAHYCEGDEHFYIDGAISPQFNGTGSEDYYLACFWPSVKFNTPFGGVAGDLLQEGGGDMVGAYYVPSSYSRFHLEAPIPFHRSVDARIQHGGLSHIRSNYRSLAYAYLRKEPVLYLTDLIDVGNPESERQHGYETSGGSEVVTLQTSPEGSYFETSLAGTGRRHAGGEVTFEVAIDSSNQGVRLRRRLDQESPRQAARVFVNGEYAGEWSHGYVNEHLRWYDSDFDIRPDLTQGKDSLDVKLVVEVGEGRGSFTDFEYQIYCFR
jgi:hypothetical protein